MSRVVERRWLELAPLFDAAFELDGAARANYLQTIADTELRDALAELLHGAEAPSRLDHGSGPYAARLLDAPGGFEGRLLGAWRVGRAIGAGGMATVYAAERADGAYAQTVAIKLLRHGLYDDYERRRFARERAILARLEHPHIARLLDGGLTGEGVPWFALEYVAGAPITAWCDARRLGVDARLALFLDVCAAVDYAHRNLVVHRDLKPSNILVGDDGGLKLLDFGIAKLLADDTDEATRTQARRLTPAYAAPEQSTHGTATTATDVYALGVLLHELLTGARPVLRADGSPKPAAAVVTGAQADTLAAARASDAARLRRRLGGELELILAKALQAEPAARYAGAAALADDLDRHLRGLPISAQADSARYRLRKFIARHRLAFAAAALIALALAAGLAATLWQARAARLEAQRADAVRDFVLGLFAGVTPDESRGRDVSARELLDRGAARLGETLAGQPALDSDLSAALAAAYRQLGSYARAAELSQQALATAATSAQRTRALMESGRTATALAHYDAAERDLREALAGATPAQRGEIGSRLAEVLVERGDLKSAAALAESALADARGARPPDGAAIARAQVSLGGIRFRAGDLAGAAAALGDAVAGLRSALGENHTQTAQAEHDLGVVVLQQGDAAKAAALFEQALATRQRLLGAEHPDIADSAFNLGTAVRRLGQRERAATLIGDAVAMQRKLLGPAHPSVASGLNSLAVIAYENGDLDTAIARLHEALAAARGAYGETHPTVATMQSNLAGFERAAGHYADAETHARAAVATATAALGANHYLVGVARLGLGNLYAEQERSADALTEIEAAHALLQATLGADHPDTVLAGAALAGVLADAGRIDEARAAADTARSAGERVLAAAPARLGKLHLIAARVDVAAHDCAAAEPLLERAQQELSGGGVGSRSDLAWAAVLRAQCSRNTPAAAEATRNAQAAIAALAFTAPALGRAAATLTSR